MRLIAASVLIFGGGLFLTVASQTVGYIVSGIKVFFWNLRVLHNTLVERYLLQRKRIVDDSAVERYMSRYSMDICALKWHVARN